MRPAEIEKQGDGCREFVKRVERRRSARGKTSEAEDQLATYREKLREEMYSREEPR